MKEDTKEEQTMTELLTMNDLLNKERLAEVKSQKAAAIFRYAKAYNTYSIPQDWAVPDAVPLLLTDTPLQVESAGHVTKFPAFLRTCPLNPRHGVLESVRCNDMDALHAEFKRLRDIMIDDDPEGCLMLMPFVSADNSAVVALSHGDFNGYAVFGPDHDGVTAGHGLQLGFPLRSEKHSDNIALKALGCSPADHELEFVFTMPEEKFARGLFDYPASRNLYLTQIRGAPEHTPVSPPPAGVDTIGMVPQGEVVINDFIMMSGLEEVAWLEENITKDNCPDGYMVVEPNGSRLSHIYAHCRGVGVPYVITESVSKGDRWVEAAPGWVVLDNERTFEPQPYSPAAFKDDFIRGLNAGNDYWAKQQGWFATFFHQWVSMPLSKPQDTAFLAGVFCAWLPKSIMALGLGEMRWATSLKSNANAPLFATITACIGEDVWVKVNDKPHLDSTRGHYFAAVGHLRPTFSQMAKMMLFLSQHYMKGWSNSYGGPAWGNSMVTGATLANSVQTFLDEPTDENLDALIVNANAAENVVHNNGFLFNKWLSKRALDAGTSGFNVREDIKNMAAAYHMAAEVLNPTDIMVAASEPQHDWDELLDFVFKKTPAYWRKNPIAVGGKVPEALRAAAKSMPVPFRHGDKGSHNSPTNKDFVMCGVETCNKCASFLSWAANHKNEVPELVEVQHLFEEGAIDIMLTPAKLDVWLVGSVVQTRASIKQQVALIKAKEFFPTPEQFKDIYAALDPADLDYPEMVNILNKFMSKQEDTEAFVNALLGKTPSDNDDKEEVKE
jgi:hypothetical protein